MKKILLILTLFACILLTGCSTNFNKTEYKNITDIKNYQKYDVKVLEFKIRTQGKTYETSDVYIRVAFLTLEELNEFKTTPLETVNNLDDYPMEFIIFEANSKVLNENNFYTEVAVGDVISLWICKYTELGNTYPYIASVSKASKVYLSTEMGLQGIAGYLDEHKSPFFQQ